MGKRTFLFLQVIVGAVAVMGFGLSYAPCCYAAGPLKFTCKGSLSAYKKRQDAITQAIKKREEFVARYWQFTALRDKFDTETLPKARSGFDTELIYSGDGIAEALGIDWDRDVKVYMAVSRQTETVPFIAANHQIGTKASAAVVNPFLQPALEHGKYSLTDNLGQSSVFGPLLVQDYLNALYGDPEIAGLSSSERSNILRKQAETLGKMNQFAGKIKSTLAKIDRYQIQADKLWGSGKSGTTVVGAMQKRSIDAQRAMYDQDLVIWGRLWYAKSLDIIQDEDSALPPRPKSVVLYNLKSVVPLYYTFELMTKQLEKAGCI